MLHLPISYWDYDNYSVALVNLFQTKHLLHVTFGMGYGKNMNLLVIQKKKKKKKLIESDWVPLNQYREVTAMLKIIFKK